MQVCVSVCNMHMYSHSETPHTFTNSKYFLCMFNEGEIEHGREFQVLYLHLSSNYRKVS